MENPVDGIEDIEGGSDDEGGEVFDDGAPANLMDHEEEELDDDGLRPYLFINPHTLPHQGFVMLDITQQQMEILDIPHLSLNDKFLYTNGSWALLLRQEEVQSIVLLNLERSLLKRLQIFVTIEGERTYAHDIRTGTFTGNIDTDYIIYLLEKPGPHHEFVIWRSQLEMIPNNDGDELNNENNNSFLVWNRRVIEFQLPGLDAFSLVYWGHALYWIIETGQVYGYDFDTELNILYVVPPNMLFHNDNHPLGPRAFLAIHDGVLLYVSAPTNAVNGVLQIRVGEFVFVEDNNIGLVEQCVPTSLCFQDGAIFLNRGQGGVLGENLVFENFQYAETVFIGPVPEDCSVYFFHPDYWPIVTAQCQLPYCEGLWFLSDHGNFCVDPWEVFDVAMWDLINPVAQEDDEDEDEEYEDDDCSSIVTEGFTRLVQVLKVREQVHDVGWMKSGLIDSPTIQWLLSLTYGSTENVGQQDLPSTRKNIALHKMVLMGDILREGIEVAYNIFLDCCMNSGALFCYPCIAVVSPSQSETHAGQATWSKLYNDIYTSDGVSLQKFSFPLSQYKIISLNKTGDLCSISSNRSDLIVCCFCPGAFLKACVGLTGIPEGDWYCQLCVSIHQRDNYIFQNFGVLPMDILTDITNKRSIFSPRYPIHGNKRARVVEMTSSNPKMLMKPGTELVRKNISAPIGTQPLAAIQSGNVLDSKSKELPSLQKNSRVPERFRSHIVHHARGMELIPTSFLTASNANQSTLCTDVLLMPFDDMKHATSDRVMMEDGRLIISQGTNDSVEELLGQIEEQEPVKSESQLAPSCLFIEQVDCRVNHLVRKLEMLLQNSDAKHATSDGGVTDGSGLIIPQGTYHLMEEQLGQTEKQEMNENLDGEFGMLITYSGAETCEESYF